MSPLILGVFAVDLHKLAINTASMVMGNPLAWESTARSVDIGIAVSLMLLCAMSLPRLVSASRIALTPLALQLLLAVLITVALVRHFDGASYFHYQRYIGGNFLLFVGAVLICRGEHKIRLAWRVWLIGATLLSLIAIWYWLTGIGWRSGRAKLVPATGIRMGYQCGAAMIYVLFARDPLLRFARFPLAAMLIFAIFTSGSKMAAVLTTGAVMLFALQHLMSRRQSSLGQFSLLVFIGFCGLLTTAIILRGDQLGFYKDTFRLDAYKGGYACRAEDGGSYMRAAMETPWGGKGISAAYDQIGGHRTHSVLQALSVQTGFPGTLVYLLFIGWLALNGLAALFFKSSLRPGRDLLMATFVATFFLVARAEIAGDIPANRELWFFSGLLLSCLVLQMRGSRGHVRIRRPVRLGASPLRRKVISPRFAIGHTIRRRANSQF